MRASGLIGLLTVCLPAYAADRPAPVVVLAEDADYNAAKAAEMVFEGVLERMPSSGTLGGPARFNPYRLSDGGPKPVVRELFVASKAPLLAVHVGQRVRVVGKLVEVAADGAKRLELWPARLETVSDTLAETPGEDGIYARSSWQPAAARKIGFRTYSFLNGSQVAREMSLTGSTASDTATALIARQLRVPAIDWNKHMVVTVCAGLCGPDEGLSVTRVVVDDKKMTVFYKMNVGGPAPGFGYPAETVLLDRCTKPVRFEKEKPAPMPKKAD